MRSNGSDSSGASVQGIPESQIPASTMISEGDGSEHLVFRFANGMFERCGTGIIRSVQITVAEGVGVEERGSSLMQPGRCATWCPIISSSCSRLLL
jgi:hypothetical protein